MLGLFLLIQVTTQTPYNCRDHAMPALCREFESMAVQEQASMRKGVVPSSGALTLPAYGSPEADREGYFCLSGQAFKRVKNGFQQLKDGSGRPQRCEVKR